MQTEQTPPEKAESHLKTRRTTEGRTREGARSILGSNTDDKEEEEERTTEENETKSRCVPASIRKYHEDHQRTVARTKYRLTLTTPRTKTNSKVNRSDTNSYRIMFAPFIDHATTQFKKLCIIIGGNVGAISPENVGMGNKVENSNIPEYMAS